MLCKSLQKPTAGVKLGEVILSVGVGVGKKRKTFAIHKALLQNVTNYFDEMIASESGQKGVIFLNDEDPVTFGLFHDWLYNGSIPTPPSKIPLKTRPSEAVIQELEADLRARFDDAERKLVDLYCLGEKMNNPDLQNATIDAIQDGFFEYGTVFGPGLIIIIFEKTTFNSPLRDLVVAANVLHIDRGCKQLRDELMEVSFITPGFFEHMMKWISRNFVMFSRRQREGYDVMKPKQGFSMLNRAKLCSCHFHKHTVKGDAHKNHKHCAVSYNKCGHGDDEEGDGASILNQMNQLFGAL